MRLDRPKLDAVLKRHLLGCPWCGGENWAPAGESAMMIRSGELKVPGPIPSINVFPVLCNDCGFVVFFDGTLYAVEEHAQP